MIHCHTLLAGFAILASLTVQFGPPACLAEEAKSFDASLSLFDGVSLDGWEGDLNHWRVDNGSIVGEIPKRQSLSKNTWLVWRGGELADFELNLQCRLTGLPAANSGIQFRCQVDYVDHVAGYQADFDMGATWLGRIYDEHGRALLVERGSRVNIATEASIHSRRRSSQIFRQKNASIESGSNGSRRSNRGFQRSVRGIEAIWILCWHHRDGCFPNHSIALLFAAR